MCHGKGKRIFSSSCVQLSRESIRANLQQKTAETQSVQQSQLPFAAHCSVQLPLYQYPTAHEHSNFFKVITLPETKAIHFMVQRSSNDILIYTSMQTKQPYINIYQMVLRIFSELSIGNPFLHQGAKIPQWHQLFPRQTNSSGIASLPV